ncbi:MAG TPA: hypothetical protein VEI03_05010, partial [Stellaceae bacterium]|nr:hypothetical protein [Stellaceae bacterium]
MLQDERNPLQQRGAQLTPWAIHWSPRQSRRHKNVRRFQNDPPSIEVDRLAISMMLRSISEDRGCAGLEEKVMRSRKMHLRFARGDGRSAPG